MSAPKIAIVGSGPSGCYMAQALRKHWADAEIAIFDRLPVPYGLVRYGVAPDHPGTKAITRQFERMFERDRIDFVGNVEIGTSVSLAEMRDAFDIVVIATGLHGDRPLGIDGEQSEHVYGAGRVTRMLNDHPDESGFAPNFGKCPLIVGNGNVAVDVLRLLAKSPVDFHGSELSSESLANLESHGIEELHIVGRSPAVLAKFDTVMVRELAKLQGVHFSISEDSILGDATTSLEVAKLEALLELTDLHRPEKSRQIVFHFGWKPKAVRSLNGRVSGLEVENDSLNTKVIEASSIITAVGFQEQCDALLKRGEVAGAMANIDAGLLDDGLFCAGWYRRGPTGTIPENRNDAKRVAEHIVAHWGSKCSSRPGSSVLQPRLKDCVNYTHWRNIDKNELSNAPEGRQRKKIRDTASMLKVAQLQTPGE
ncbi:FAD-dependent oxidoreductase [Pseudomonas putida]|uniref:FAD-dependent oxidoreductase n=1 Tax=Pseudomonas putida TaxID=303 RepID=UPI003905BB2E